MERTLYRSTSKKLIAGVAGGIAEYFAIDPVLVRALFIALLFGSGVSVIIYLVLWLIVPKQPAIPVTQTEPHEVDICINEPISQDESDHRSRRRNIFGIVLICSGLLLLADSVFDSLCFSDWWPLLLIAVGIYFLFGTINLRKGGNNE